ncbi:hypothetical protein [Streptomyces fumanus]|uniref:Uncharacterized protein n=1 Tax=Streptomyces fumanus TaxID=67302 RepID=A0A919ABP2_9ACTN|nr:hypothetical protein [Streptomyces fumanus]GHE97498.1 hypothetical protein GCM10018772_22160 [Streptomyces fumanus]
MSPSTPVLPDVLPETADVFDLDLREIVGPETDGALMNFTQQGCETVYSQLICPPESYVGC